MVSSNRTNSLQSSGSFIPEIVISNTDEFHHPRRMDSYTPSLSLIYDFDASRKNSILSDLSGLSGHSAGSDCFQVTENNYHEDDVVIRAARQRSASRADTGESAKSAPIAALSAAYKVRSRDNSLKMKHSSTSSLSPHRHKLTHEITIDVP
uniref:Uncharacterized protein n=2 Tax=Panagrolaimus TaxID=55784 RepID=A0A914PKH5_9BILA